MARDGSTAPDAGGGPPDPWRLLGRLSEALAQVGGDCAACALTAARVLAQELGDAAMVVVLDPPGDERPAVGTAHRNPSRAPAVRAAVESATEDDLRQFVAEMSDRAGEAGVTPVPAAARARYAQAYGQYVGEFGTVGTLFAPLRAHGKAIGLIACTRDGDAEPFRAEDTSMLAAAARHIVLLLEAVTARAEEQARAHDWRVAFERAPIPMGILSGVGLITAINDAGCVVLGRERAELLGQPWQQYLHAEGLVPELEDVAGTATAPPVLRRFVRPDGSVRWVQLTMTALTDATGRVTSYHAQGIDLTPHLEAEARSQRFSALVHSSPDFVAIAGLDGRVQFVNDAGRRLVGVPAEVDLTATSITDFLTPSGVALSLEVEQPAVLRDGFWQGQSTLRDWRDGSSIPVSITSFLMRDEDSGDPLALATVQRDIREQLAARQDLEALAEERRRLLTELVQAEQAERTRIAADVHDDAVQMFAAAQLRLQLLDRQARELGSESVSAAAAAVEDLVVSGVARLRKLLLELEPPELVGNNLDDALRAAASRLFDGSGVQVVVEGRLDDLPPDVAAVLHRAVREALTNVRLHAQAKNVAVTLSGDASRGWRIQVVDDGRGLDGVPEPRAGHLGIRGMMSRVEALGGTCRIASQPLPGRGVVVELAVPGRSA